MKRLKVELHTHTHESYDVGMSYYDAITRCIDKGIDVLGVTDHNEIEGALRMKTLAPFKVIVGQEVMTKDGEIIGLFLSKKIPSGLSLKETLNAISAQGGISYLPHPFDKTTRKTALKREALSLFSKEIDVIEIHNGRSVIEENNREALRFASNHKMVTGVGSDVHTKYEYGRNYQLLNNFDTPAEFIGALKNAKNVTHYPLLYPFLITKYERRKKKLFPQKTLVKSRVCDLCESKRYHVLYEKAGRELSVYKISDDSYGSHPQIVECASCKLVYAYPRETKKNLLSRYTQFSDSLYEAEREARKVNYNKILDSINRLKPHKGSLLDVGCATGAFIEIAAHGGWNVTGIEPSKWAVKQAKENYGLNVIQGTLDTHRFKPNSFDCIVCIDVIEHVDSPDELVSRMNRLLKKDGLLVIVTPNKGAMISRILGEHWWHVRPDHIYYFTRETLSLMLIKHNFFILSLRNYAWRFSFDYWASRFKRKSPIIYRTLMSIKRIPVLKYLTQKSYSINFHDSMEIYVQKNS